jgi:alginate O-acetyltransferase complex protein AlgI
MFNIQLPQNFNSPYKATNIQDFWRRWHMTLSRFLKEYLYVPLGGNRGGETRTVVNLFITFLLGGLWHGAGWTFVAWGALHGAGSVVHRTWRRMGLTMPRALAWPFTFLFVHLAWVYFRATSFEQGLAVTAGMVNLDGMAEFGRFAAIGPANRLFTLAAIVPGVMACFLAPNSQELARRFSPQRHWMLLVIGLLLISTLFMNSLIPKEFLYFDF